ncbi:MAG: peptidoglycan editing factor PgeF [Clostridiales bacterium]|jgi:YfiH family protein|nr:peptidoglycan editing factor PgeF [Clostridiales bacterium]
MKPIHQMHLMENQGVSYLVFPELSKFPWLNHAFSTRLGGVSQGEFSSMNLNFNRGDPDETVLENYRRFCRGAGFDYDGLVASAQDHHTEIRRVTAKEAGIGIWKPRDRKSVDGLITNEPGVTLVTYYADCVPLYFVDTEKKAIGLAHAGWRGTVAEMGAKMVEAMRKEFGSDPSQLLVAIGPSIGSCCYEVDLPVYEQVMALEGIDPASCLQELDKGKYMLDLWEVNRRVIHRAGVPEPQIFVGGVCTKCHLELLFSHRVMGAKRGGMAAMMAIR